MRKKSFGKSACNWLGILSIVIQAFMPVWHANAEAAETGPNASDFAEICFALTEASGTTPINKTPFNQYKAGEHCLLCQFPGFGTIHPDVVTATVIPFDHVRVQYYPSNQLTWSQLDDYGQPPTRAPPV